MKINQMLSVSGSGFILDHRIIENADGESFTSHIHEAWELLFFLRGNVTYHVEGKRYKLHRGDIVLSKPSVFHHIEPNDGSPYERYNIIFDGHLVPDGIRKRIAREVDVFSFSGEPRMFELFDKMDSYATLFDGEDLSRIISHLIEEVLYNLAVAEDKAYGNTVTNPLVIRALGYIDENLTTLESIDRICEALYITKSHLHHLFSNNVGVTPKQYITSKRLLLAQKMIRRGRRVTEVASAVGFLDYATFFRNYKRYFGYSPTRETNCVTLEGSITQ